MGGRGSGRYHRYYTKRNVVDDYTLLDINTFRKRGRWRWFSAIVTWTRGEVVTARVGYTLLVDSIRLEWYTPDGQVTKQSIPLAMVQKGIGTRYYFGCPGCGKRVVHLYAGDIFLCRHCHNLTYESCQNSHKRHLVGLSDKQYRNLLKTAKYERELRRRKRVGRRMIERLLRYRKKSGIIFGRN
jgi:hypothetical protein